MIRLFETNRIRRCKELEGLWDFTKIRPDGSAGEGPGYRLPVPGCWESHPDLATYQGQGKYVKDITIDEPGHLRFVFKGVSHTADVYWDGEKIGHHYNAYTAFDCLVKDAKPGRHRLEVRVDNSFHEGSSLHVHNDYYTYGGLIRPVGMEWVADAYIERMACTPRRTSDGWKLDIQAVIRNLSSIGREVEIRGEAAGASVAIGPLLVPADSSAVVSKTIDMPNVQPWSHADPRLYEVALQLLIPGMHGERPVDDLIDRVGFRIVTTHDGKIQVNGEDIVLKGFNRHEDHTLTGASLPVQLMVQDLDLMADMGCNSVRTSHYPNDERFLDLCDERGFYVWEENHARGLTIEQMRNPNFIAQCADVNREMVEQHVNHPCIITWGILNECASYCEEGKAHYKRQFEQIRAMDDSRPLTFASCHRERELCFDLVDIVSFNLYPGWYGTEDPGELCDRARGWADASGGRGKPMIMSEFGGDGFYGYRSPLRVKGTEERQADILEANLSAYEQRAFISGMFIWQFCDCRVSEEQHYPITRVYTQNNKGVVDGYRRPKLAYEVVKKHFRA